MLEIGLCKFIECRFILFFPFFTALLETLFILLAAVGLSCERGVSVVSCRIFS